MYLSVVACWSLLQFAFGDSAALSKLSIPELIAELDAKNAKTRYSAVLELCGRGAAAKAAVPRLMVLLRTDSDDYVRYVASLALGRTGASNKAVVSALVEALGKDSAFDVRSAAADALGELGADAKTAVAALTAALKDTDPNVRDSAAGALCDIGPDESATRALRSALADKSSFVCAQAAAALLWRKSKDRAAFLVLIRALTPGKDPNNEEDARGAALVAGAFLLRGRDQDPSIILGRVDSS
jgi:HEAT repeat protein